MSEEEEVSFSGESQNYCVCFVSMVDHDNGIAKIISAAEKIRRYYFTFVNTMTIIAKNFSGKIVKNTQNGLIIYFPETSEPTNKSAFKDVIECGITRIAANNTINAKLKEEGLPPLYYRISADYGTVQVARSNSSQSDDLFGSIMNICAKINSKAPPNGMVIGGDLYQIIRAFSLKEDYDFKEVVGYSIGGFTYPVYSVVSKYEQFYDLDVNEQIAKLKQLQANPSYFALSSAYRKLKLDTLEQQKKETQEKEPPTNILLVDDEEDTLYTFNEGLSSEGYNVVAFTDSMEALTHFATVNPSHYDLAVLDIRMPDLNGLQLYYRLKAINRNIKILFVSALDAVPELISLLPDVKTTNDIIKKPLALDDFVNAVKTALVQ